MKNQWHSVIFIDLDNTIIEGPFESVVFPLVFRELSQESGLEVREVRRLVVEENLRRQTDCNIPAILAMDWDDIFKTIAERLGVELELSALEIVKSHACTPYSVVLDDAPRVLEQLAQPHRAIVAASKGLRKYQMPVLDALNLTSLFTEILTPDSNNALKQDVSFYGKWPNSTRLQISVGDHYQDDLVAPKKFGFKTIWKPLKQSRTLEESNPFVRAAEFDYGEGQSLRPDAIILSVQELPEVVEHLEQDQLL